MALTSDMINRASDHLGEREVALWMFHIRKLPQYKKFSIYYEQSLEEKILDAEGTIKARMLNALLAEIDDLDVGEVHIGGDQRTIGVGGGDREGTHWSQTIERLTLIEEGFSILFADEYSLNFPIPPTTGADGSITSELVATGNRVVYAKCAACSASFMSNLTCTCRVRVY
jgi:hypothetical protein